MSADDYRPSRPEVLGQGDTGVFPEYRNRGLGRWLKAPMIEKVLRHRPQVKRVHTGNTKSNAPNVEHQPRDGLQARVCVD